MLACQVLECLQSVIYEDETVVGVVSQFFVINDGIGTSVLKCLQRILIAVKLLAFQCKEDAAFRAVA